MPDSLFLSLGHDTLRLQIEVDDGGEAVFRCGAWATSVGHLTDGVRHALLTMAESGGDEEQLVETVLAGDGITGLATFYYYLRLFTRLRLLRRSLVSNGTRLATLVPVSDTFEYASREPEPGISYQLSRFAFARVESGELVVESPLSHARLILHDWRAAVVAHALSAPVSADRPPTRIPEFTPTVTGRLMALMLSAGFLTPLRETGHSAEHEEPALRSWQFHDLLFHTHSREGRHDLPIGGTYRFAGEVAPPPALKASAGDRAIPLFRPDLERCREHDPPFAAVQDRRCSIRHYGTRPISLVQLGEFLYRVARVTDHQEVEISTALGPVHTDFAHRPYPGGGALYELELYVAVNRCEGLAAGFYYYDPQRHTLERRADPTCDVQLLLSGASRAAGIDAETIQVLLTVAARFQRIAWKYSSIAYATTLKNVGVLYQTMYLVATAMELAPCGLGCGNADLFARLAATNYFEETSVGEFLLGSRPPAQP